jgi:hypothetical protein
MRAVKIVYRPPFDDRLFQRKFEVIQRFERIFRDTRANSPFSTSGATKRLAASIM